MNRPLADRVRPKDLDGFVGQDEIVRPGSILRKAIEEDRVPSMIFWGPPGSGKTTLAYIIAALSKANFLPFSAVTSGIAEVKDAIKRAKADLKMFGRRTILLVDELHRFNRAQQDAFLPHIEKGAIIFIGATTENPSFEVNAPLLSRCRVLIFKPLGPDEIVAILKRAIADPEDGYGKVQIDYNEDDLRFLAQISGGDARVGLNVLEYAVEHLLSETSRIELISGSAVPAEKGFQSLGQDAQATKERTDPGQDAPATGGSFTLTRDLFAEAFQKRLIQYDKAGEEHFNLISALHKAMRGSDPDAALYYLYRMLEAGEDPLYIARRIVRFASEDVGLADPLALSVAVAAKDAVHFIGLPEGKLSLAQAVVYLACAPKSNSLYKAESEVLKTIQETGYLPVPMKIRNPVTDLMKEAGYGEGYKYPHQAPGGYIPDEYLPEKLAGKRFYEPKDIGEERTIKEGLEKLRGEEGESSEPTKEDETEGTQG